MDDWVQEGLLLLHQRCMGNVVLQKRPCSCRITLALAMVPPYAQDSAEFGRIGKYYATESMLVWDESIGRYREDLTPGYGKDTLEEFFG